MKKIGNVVYSLAILLAAVISLTSTQDLSAQDFSIEASVSESQIFIGEQFSLDIEVRGSSVRSVALPVLPQIDGIRVLSSTPSRSSSISIVNGQTTTTTSYTYTLIARERGHVTIPPVTVTIDGEEYTTNSLDIEIIEKGSLSEEGRRQRPDIFLEIEVDDENPVTGQQIVASLNLYFRQGLEISSFQPRAGWRTDGFWKEELQNIRQPSAETILIDGVRYRTATLMRYALFPTRSGELTLSEFPLAVGVRNQPSRDDPFGSFFGGSGTNQRRVSIESEPVKVNVQPLPAPQNALAINAVGDLNIERTIDTREVVSGEPVELTTKITGTGNIPLVRKPDYSFPDGLELYSPQESSNIERRGLTIQGDRTFTQLFTTRSPGSYTIPAERVAVFNPASRSFSYITLPELSFEAAPSPSRQLASMTDRDLQLQPVTGLAVWQNSQSRSFLGTVWFWLLLALPLIGLAVAYRQRLLHHKLTSDTDFARSHTAKKRANERIDQARELVKENKPKEIYSLLHKSITGYIADKLGLPAAGLSDAEITEHLWANGCGADLQRKINRMLNKCATISYAPTGDKSDFHSDIDKTEELINQLKDRF